MAPGWKEGLGVILLAILLVVVLLPSVHWEVLFSQHDNRESDNRESILKKYHAIWPSLGGIAADGPRRRDDGCGNGGRETGLSHHRRRLHAVPSQKFLVLRFRL